tara:strand:+ start:294 stop:644 length:351 start_codon:yes stop_codon:yes gene_type:complete
MPIDKKEVEARGFRLSRLYSRGPYRLTPVVDSYGEPIDAGRAGFANIQKGNRELGEKAKYWYSHGKTPQWGDTMILISFESKLEWVISESMNWLAREGYGMEIDYRTGKIGPARYE